MTFDRGSYYQHRRSIRLPGYDYSSAGAYFVTICTEGRRPLFGDATDDEMHHNGAGRMVEECAGKLSTKFGGLTLDAFIVMPNHIHAVIALDDTGTADLPSIMTWFKTMTTNAYIRGVKDFGWPRFDGRLWQRNYFERIIRDEAELDRVRAYVEANPAKWTGDEHNPERGGRPRGSAPTIG
jgi:putative transposase